MLPEAANSGALGFLKNPLVTLALAILITFGNWWRNSDRLSDVEAQVVTKESKEHADERHDQIMERLRRIEDKLDKLSERDHLEKRW